MNEPAATPLDRLIAALARKAVADHLARAADEADQKQHARAQPTSTRREAA